MRSANSIATSACWPSGIASQAQFDQASNALDLGHQQVANARAASRRRTRQSRRRSGHRARAPSAGRAGAGGSGSRAARSVLHPGQSAGGRHRHQGGAAAGRRLHRGLRAGVRAGVDARCVDRGEFQGGAARPHAARVRPRPWKSIGIGGKRFAAQSGEREPGHGIAVLDASAGECHRQLGQGRAAGPGPLAARPCRSRVFCCRRVERQCHGRYAVAGRCLSPRSPSARWRRRRPDRRNEHR